MPVDVEALRTDVAEGRIQWHQHALERLLERGISRTQVLRAILQGEVIEVYKDDRPDPRCLFACLAVDPLHVVVARDSASRLCLVVTAYRPDREHFETDLKTRRKKT